MDAIQVLTAVRSAGFELRVRDGQLEVSPSARLSPELRDALRSAKPTLTALAEALQIDDPETRDERLAITLEGCGLDPTIPEAQLRHLIGLPEPARPDADDAWQSVLDRLSSAPGWSPEDLEQLRHGEARWDDAPAVGLPEGLADPWEGSSIGFDGLEACEKCGRYHLWQTLSDGRWRCRDCDPPRLTPRAQ